MPSSLKVLAQGLYCPPGEFFIDAFRPVPMCIVTHAHSDHAYFGHGLYIATKETLAIIKQRIGDVPAKALEYGERIKLGKAWVSLHPAGHILGSAQVKIETPSNITVISGDYKRAFDATCASFEVVECDTFVTESTFALPIYNWPSNDVIAQQIATWWADNASQGRPSVLFCYALGKAQRILSLLRALNKTVYVHGAIFSLCQLYETMGVKMAPYKSVSQSVKGFSFSKELILAPPSALGSAWMKRFPLCRLALASGWMEVRGTRRRKALDRGFVLSDHADWQDLIQTVGETKASTILTTHGNAASLARYLTEEKKVQAQELQGLEFLLENED